MTEKGLPETGLPLPPELERLTAFIDSHIECLAGPNRELRSIALHAAKHVFDWALETERPSEPHLGILLSTLTEATPPQTRSQARRTSIPRRSSSPVQKRSKKFVTRETPLPSLLVEGMNIDQIWQQLDLRAARVCENLQILLGDEEKANSDGEDGSSAGSEDEDEGMDEDEEEDAEEMDIDEDEDIWEELSDEEEDGGSTAEGVVNLRDEISEDNEDERPAASVLDVNHGHMLCPSVSHSSSNLDDGFFDLATFNAETSKLEAKDVLYKKKRDRVGDEDSAEESDVDLFVSIDGSITEGADDGIGLFYHDFFEPPSRVQGRNARSSKVRFHEQVSVRKIKAVGKGMPVSFMDDEDSDEEYDSDESDGTSKQPNYYDRLSMSLWKRKDKSLIPPVQSELTPPPGASRSSSRTTSPLPSYYSNASTYVASRDGLDPYNTMGKSNQSGINDYESSIVKTSTSNTQSQLDRARGELFAGYDPEKAGSGRFFNGPETGREPAPGEENEEDVEGIKQQTRFLKQDSVNSTRNALRMAREAEETARGTLGRLADQSEKLANTERHLDMSKSHTLRAGDQIDELKKLNRSIFRPAITFNKDAKRAAQETKIQQRYEDERREREKAMMDIRETQNRLGRAATYGGQVGDEGIHATSGHGNLRFRTEEQLAARKEQRKRFQFEAEASDDELEDELDDNLDEISKVTKNLKLLGTAMGQELDVQNKRLDVITDKATTLDNNVFRQTERLKKIK